MQERLTEKGILFVTGGSHGIGEAIIQEVGHGYHRVVNYDFSISPNLDVRNPTSLRSEIDKTLIKGEVQHDLVVSAGVIIYKRFLEQTPDEIAFQLSTNLIGAIYAVHTFLSWHKDNGHRIRPNIVVISSVSAHLHEGDSMATYEASKAGLSHFVQSLADPGRKEFIINAIEPGTIRETRIGGWRSDGPFDQPARAIIEAAQAEEVKMLPVEVTKKDIAEAVRKLLFENQNGDTNGQLIPVDGGYSRLKQ